MTRVADPRIFVFPCGRVYHVLETRSFTFCGRDIESSRSIGSGDRTLYHRPPFGLAVCKACGRRVLAEE